MLRSHECGKLRTEHVGQKVALAGWVHRRRDLGGLIFIDLRDRSGFCQVVFRPEVSKESHTIAEQIRNEYVLFAEGKVVEQGRDKKVSVIKYKSKTRYLRNKGHRQAFTEVEISKIA